MDELTNFEKLIESVNMLATLIRTYYEGLRERGFSDDQAMFLVEEYQTTVLNFAKNDKKRAILVNKVTFVTYDKQNSCVKFRHHANTIPIPG